MRFFKSLLLMIIIISFSCKNKQDQSTYMDLRLKEVTSLYRKDLLSMNISPNITSHFPLEIKKLPITQYWNKEISSGNIYYYLIQYDIDRSTIDSLCYASKSLFKFGDCNLNIVVSTNEKSFIKYESISKNSSSSFDKKNCIIPVFKTEETYGESNLNLFDTSSISGLSKSFDIFIIDSKPGIFYPDIKPLKSMPKGWENGFSRGIAVNQKDNIIIYWFVIW